MGVFEFLNRHRNKILLAGGAAGAILIMNKVLAGYEKQWQTSSSRGFVHEARKKEIHFENIIDECNKLCQRMSPKIIDRLQEQLDESQLVEKLSSKRKDGDVQDKVQLWAELKVKILTRLLSEIYSTCFLVCYTRVQMSVIGGQVFAANVASSTSGASSSSASVADLTSNQGYIKYISLMGTSFDQRFDSIIQIVENAVDETLKDYSTDFCIGIQDFRSILDKIKQSVSFALTNSGKIFCVDENKALGANQTASSSDSMSAADDKKLKGLLEETKDILESPDFRHVLESGIEVGYTLFHDMLLGAFMKVDTKLKGSGDAISNPNNIKVPFVKVLPQIRKSYLKRTEADKRTLVNHLLRLDVLNCFAANVYEAFCQPR